MENELYHYGRKGMKWYQNIFTKGKEASAARKKRKAEKAKAAEEKRKESVEEQKTRIRNSRSAEQVYKNAHLFNDKELNEIYNRLNTENNIKNLIPAKVNKGKKFVDSAASTAKSVSTLVGNATDLYNKVNTVFKLFNKNAPAAKNAESAPGSKGKGDDKGKGKSKDKDKNAEVVEGIIEEIPGYKKSNTSSSNSAPKSKPIIDVHGEVVNDNVTALARSMTRNAGKNTVSFVMNNHDRLESGANFVNGLLALPAPKDD